jgi:4-amino-4-deoxy-L-arabinose transferase-like glycosyltransferase
MTTLRSRLLLLILTAAVATAAWAVRPLMAPGETRELAIAWEMWSSGDALVPQLNGEPQVGTPPLKTWMLQAGWIVSGPNALWARLLGAFAALLAAAAVARAARLLWGESGDPQWRTDAATMVFLGLVFVQMMATAVGGSLWLAVASVLAWSHLARARDERRFAWAGVALATAIGLLAAGPVALLFTVPAWLAGRTWAAVLLPKGWWLRGARAFATGIALFLAWAIPASLQAGGGVFGAVLHRAPDGMLDAGVPAGASPAWTAAAIVMLLFPWILWSPLWRGWLSGIRRDPALRLLLWCTLPGLGVITLLQGSLRPTDLAPALPAFALGCGRILERRDRPFTQGSLFLPAFVTMGTGVLLLFLPSRAVAWGLPTWVADANGFASGTPLMVGGMLLVLGQNAGLAKAFAVAAMGPMLVIALHLGVAKPAQDWEVAAASKQVALMQREEKPVAFFSEQPYQGEFQFLGRLREPLAEPRTHRERLEWLRANSDGAVIVDVPPGAHNAHLIGSGTTMTFPYRGHRLALWKADALYTVLKRAGRGPLADAQ